MCEVGRGYQAQIKKEKRFLTQRSVFMIIYWLCWEHVPSSSIEKESRIHRELVVVPQQLCLRPNTKGQFPWFFMAMILWPNLYPSKLSFHAGTWGQILSLGVSKQNGTTHLSCNLAESWSHLYLCFREGHVLDILISCVLDTYSSFPPCTLSWLLRQTDAAICCSTLTTCCNNQFISEKVRGLLFCTYDAYKNARHILVAPWLLVEEDRTG